MDDARGVGGSQRVRDLAGDAERLGDGQALLRDRLAQGPAAQVLHHDEVHAVFERDVVDGDDVGVVEGGGRARLAQEAGPAHRIARPVGREDLERHEAMESGIAGFVHDGHAPLAQLLHDLVVEQLPADHRAACVAAGAASASIFAR